MTEDVVEARITNEIVLTNAQIEKLRRVIGYNEFGMTECKINFNFDIEKYEQAIDNVLSVVVYD